jgi:putative transposase/transposase-like zinc-binding protein
MTVRYQHPLKKILRKTIKYWEREEVRPEVRQSFRKALQCGTLQLGAEVFASEHQERIICHTCKSRGCTSCGHWATIQWQRERWVALPDVAYKGITFTMPKELWALFRENRSLTEALPALAASAIQAWIAANYGLRVGVMAILHTFNGRLEFNSHVHTMVTGGGFQSTSGSWGLSVNFDYTVRDRLMKFWRAAVINLLRSANNSGLLRSKMTPEAADALLTKQGERWWSVNIQSFKSKEHFLRYAGRYVRRPPIAQRRITYIGERSVRFWVKDKKLRKRVCIECSLEEFVDRWAQHIPERYRHTMRHFGLFSPQGLNQTSAVIFASIGQKQRPQAKRIPWAASLKRTFGRDALIDRKGNRMRWARRLRLFLPDLLKKPALAQARSQPDNNVGSPRTGGPK